MDKADGLGQARQNLTDYLRLNSLRNTPERNALLEVVYSTDVPMQAEELARLMTEGGRLRISRATVYNNLLYSDMLPTLLDWRTDSWLLPVVSAHPSMERMKSFLVKKKFIWISPNSEGAEVVALLKFLTPDAAPCETDCTNADTVED